MSNANWRLFEKQTAHGVSEKHEGQKVREQKPLKKEHFPQCSRHPSFSSLWMYLSGVHVIKDKSMWISDRKFLKWRKGEGSFSHKTEIAGRKVLSQRKGELALTVIDVTMQMTRISISGRENSCQRVLSLTMASMIARSFIMREFSYFRGFFFLYKCLW